MTARDVIAAAIRRYELEIAGSPPADWSEWSERDPETAAIYQTHAGDILAALDAAGLAVVQREATRAMIFAPLDRNYGDGLGDFYGGIWRAMIEAATKEPQE